MVHSFSCPLYISTSIGEHVDLDSVVGDYTKEAYEGIANGKYPAGMEDVIRNYFENLN